MVLLEGFLVEERVLQDFLHPGILLLLGICLHRLLVEGFLLEVGIWGALAAGTLLVVGD